MPNCKLCGQSAGLLKDIHPECGGRHRTACDRIRRVTYDLILSGSDCTQARTQAIYNGKGNFVTERQTEMLLAEAWNAVLDFFLADGILSPDQERLLRDAASHLQLKQGDLVKVHNVPEKILMARTLRAIVEGDAPTTANALARPMSLPFNFLKGEDLVWSFQDVVFAREVSRKEYVSGNAGIGFHLGHGYVRVGGHRGGWVESSGLEVVDTGLLALTTKHVYFGGGRGTHRTAYSKIVGFEYLTDGFGFVADGARSLPEVFRTGHGWFAYNLALNLAYQSQS